MISKIIIVAIATGIGLASYIPKGIDEAMNNHQRISEHMEYKKIADTAMIEQKVEEMVKADEAKELVNKAELEELEVQLEEKNAVEIQQYLEEHSIPYELIKGRFYTTYDDERNTVIYHQWYIVVTKGKYELNVMYYDKDVEWKLMGVQEVDN